MKIGFDYSLDGLCKHYGLPGKDESVAREAIIAAGLAGEAQEASTSSHTCGNCRRALLLHMPKQTRSRRWRFTRNCARFSTLKGRREAYRLDCDLLPCVLAMRKRGVRIDQSAAEQARDVLLGKRDAALKELSEHLGITHRHGGDRRPLMEDRDLQGTEHRGHGEDGERRDPALRPASSDGWRRRIIGCPD